MIEDFNLAPKPAVADAEFRRLLGYPPGHVPGLHAQELAARARDWFAVHGRPWTYLRETRLQLTGQRLHLDGVDFHSRQLHGHLLKAGAQRAVLVVVSAGRECEEHARQLWQDAKPDEYYFLETFGSAVVEQLVAATSGRICDLAEHDGLMAVPHYSPGYQGWNVADQNRLFGLVTLGLTRPFPGPIEVLSSGMLRPKKSMLAVFGLAERGVGAAGPTPCESCSFAPCRYRRTPYRHAPGHRENISAPVADPDGITPLARGARYTVNPRALRKWAQERVRIEHRDSGSIEACFRFDGTTCSNLGRPLAFDYLVTLSDPRNGYRILRADCRPASGDEGYTQMCAHLGDAGALMHAIEVEKPLLGRPLNDVLGWIRPAAPSGCHCSADSRAHKWGLALEAIHYTLFHLGALATPGPSSLPP
jgi:hypothetical protein